MSQNEQELTEGTITGQPTKQESESDSSESEHMVRVSEAIKYRRRAQTAEQKLEQLQQQLHENEEKQKEMQLRFEEAALENELIQQLVHSGAMDIEASLLLIKQKIKGSSGKPKELRSLVDNLRQEKPYLFSHGQDSVVSTLAGPTAGAKGQVGGRGNRLLRLAQQAQRSGSRKDIQEYLRVRRSIRV